MWQSELANLEVANDLLVNYSLADHWQLPDLPTVFSFVWIFLINFWAMNFFFLCLVILTREEIREARNVIGMASV